MGGAKRGRDGGESGSDDDEEEEGGDAPAAAAAPRRGERGAAAAEDGPAPMDADEPISDAEEEEQAAAAPPAGAAEAIRRAVDEVGQGTSGAACSVTGVKAVLAAHGSAVSTAEIHEGAFCFAWSYRAAPSMFCLCCAALLAVAVCNLRFRLRPALAGCVCFICCGAVVLCALLACAVRHLALLSVSLLVGASPAHLSPASPHPPCPLLQCSRSLRRREPSCLMARSFTSPAEQPGLQPSFGMGAAQLPAAARLLLCSVS